MLVKYFLDRKPCRDSHNQRTVGDSYFFGGGIWITNVDDRQFPGQKKNIMLVPGHFEQGEHHTNLYIPPRKEEKENLKHGNYVLSQGGFEPKSTRDAIKNHFHD